MKDIELRWSAKEEDIEVTWSKGEHKGAAFYLLDLFGRGFQEEMKKRGYDLKTIKLSINKLKEIKE